MEANMNNKDSFIKREKIIQDMEYSIITNYIKLRKEETKEL